MEKKILKKLPPLTKKELKEHQKYLDNIEKYGFKGKE